MTYNLSRGTIGKCKGTLVDLPRLGDLVLLSIQRGKPRANLGKRMSGTTHMKNTGSPARPVIDDVRSILIGTLGLPPAIGARLTADSPLLGALPELDSMVVAGLLTALEEHFDIVIDESDIDADIFTTLGTLSAFISRQVES